MTASARDLDHPLDPPPVAGSIPKPPAAAPDHGRAIREFEALCMKHRLACGAEENLAPFLTALGENKLLAMNFWSTVARLGDGKHGLPLAPHDVLAVIVRAVTGRSVEDAGEAQQLQIDSLARLLAGEDIALATAPPGAGPDPSQPPLPRPPSGDANTAEVIAQIDRHSPDAAPPSLPAAANYGSRNAGSRLILVADPPRSDTPRTLGAAIAAAPELAELLPQTHPADAMLEPARLRIRSQEPAEPRIVIPFSAYAANGNDKPNVARRAGIFLLVLAIVGGVGSLSLRDGGAWRQTATAWLHSRNAAPLNSTPASEISATGPTAAAVAADTTQAAPNTAAAPAGSANNPTPASAAAAAAIASSPSSATLASGPRDAISRSQNAAETADDGRDAALVQVPGDEMHNHLISSRFPIVPDAANADAVTGVVTLHAVITAAGSVEHLHALSGPPALRQPAIDAVSSWRYRPYLVDGTPTDVSTTIRVDFSGND